MPLRKLMECLEANGIEYETITHPPAYTAQEIAASAHIPGREVAKTVILKVDGSMIMAVIPATEWVNLDLVRHACKAKNVTLADEDEFKSMFPDCEPGAMPPFGNLWNMDVFVSDTLADDEEIAFNAGSHSELVKCSYSDFERVVHPRVIYCSSGA